MYTNVSTRFSCLWASPFRDCYSSKVKSSRIWKEAALQRTIEMLFFFSRFDFNQKLCSLFSFHRPRFINEIPIYFIDGDDASIEFYVWLQTISMHNLWYFYCVCEEKKVKNLVMTAENSRSRFIKSNNEEKLDRPLQNDKIAAISTLTLNQIL